MPPPPEDQLAQIREAIGRLFERMRDFETRLEQMEHSQPLAPSEALPPVRAEIVPLAELSPPAETTQPDFQEIESEPGSAAPSSAAPSSVPSTDDDPPTSDEPSAERSPRKLSLEEKLQLLSAMGKLGEEIEEADTSLSPAEQPKLQATEQATEQAKQPTVQEAVVISTGEAPVSDTAPRPAPLRLAEEFLAKLQAKLREKLKDLEWEQFIGAKGAMWAGAILVILAIAYGIQTVFTLYDSPPLKSAGFHLMGLGFLGAGYYLYKKKKAALLGEALAGLGIFTLYGVAFAGKRMFEAPLYGSMTDTVTFIECCAITLLAVGIAVRVPSVVVVMLGALGGYLTPFVIGGDPPNHVLLFSYLAFLNVTLIASAVLRKWSFLKPLTFAATAGVFWLWLHDPYFVANIVELRWSTEWMVVLHAAIFLLGSTIPPVLWKRRSNQLDLAVLSSSSLWLMGMTWQLFRGYPQQELALVSWGLAALHMGLFGLTFSRVTNVDRMPRIHLALAAIFLTLAAPLQLEDASFLAMAWAAEGVAFALVGLWFCDRQMYVSSLLVFTLSGLHLLGWVLLQDSQTFEGSQIEMRAFVFACTGLLAMIGACAYKWMPGLRERATNAWEEYSSIVLFLCGNIAVLLGILLQWQGSRTVLALWTLDVAIVWAIGFGMRSQLARVYALFLASTFLASQLLLQNIADPPEYALLLNSRFGTLVFAGGLFAVVGWLYSWLKPTFRELPAATGEHAKHPITGAVHEFSEPMLHVPLSVIGHVLLLGAILCEVHSGSLLNFAATPERETFILTVYSLASALYATALVAGGMALGYPLYRILAACVGVAVLVKVAGVDCLLSTYRVAEGRLDIRFLMGEACALIIGLTAASYLLPALRRMKFDKAERNTAMIVLGLANMVALLAMTCQWEHRLVLALWAVDVAIVWTLGFWRNNLALRCYGVLLAGLFLGGRIVFHKLDDPDPYRIILNARFATLLLVAAVLGVFGWLYSRLPRQEKNEVLFEIDLDERPLHVVLGSIAHGLALTAVLCEINSGILQQVADSTSRFTIIMTWCTLAAACYGAVLWGGGVALRYQLYRILAAIVAGGVLLKAATYDYAQPAALWWNDQLDLRFLLGEMSTLLVAGVAATYLLPALRSKLQPAKAERMTALVLLGLANLVAMILMDCQFGPRVVLIVWTLNAAAVWAVGFRRDSLSLRWYATALGLLWVGGRMLYEGASYAEPYRLLANGRFLSLALIAAVYFAAGWNYRRRRLSGANTSSDETTARMAEMREQGLGADEARQILELEDKLDPVLGVLANAVLVVALSLEVHTWFAVAAEAGRTPFANMDMAHQASYSILWAVYAAGMVVAGFLLRYPLFRYLGLAAFGPILLKVFFVDLADLEMLPRVFALAVLGAMLLGVAFLYQRFAARILEPPAAPEEEPPEQATAEQTTTPNPSAAEAAEEKNGPAPEE